MWSSIEEQIEFFPHLNIIIRAHRDSELELKEVVLEDIHLRILLGVYSPMLIINTIGEREKRTSLEREALRKEEINGGTETDTMHIESCGVLGTVIRLNIAQLQSPLGSKLVLLSGLVFARRIKKDLVSRIEVWQGIFLLLRHSHEGGTKDSKKQYKNS